MRTIDLYLHKYFNERVQITNTAGAWVEFLIKSKNELRWLEASVFGNTFDYAYSIAWEGPTVAKLAALRKQASNLGILIPKEFKYS